MSGQLILGLAGAAVGAFLGPAGSVALYASIGWTVGTLAGSLLFPGKVQGPRLNDTKVQGAEYGTVRPWVFGMMRVGGIGCGQGSTVNGINKFTEHEEKSSGKGGPEITNYRYTLSFFNEMCEGVIVGVNRRWANSRLVTDVDGPSGGIWPYTLYLGDAEQMPDPTMELVYGAGEVTPMRGIAYESVEEIDVTDYGNARPNVEYEVFTKAGTVPTRIATFTPWPTPNGTTAHYGATYDNGVITTTSLDSAAANYVRAQWDIDGTQIGSTTSTAAAGGVNNFGIRNLNSVFFGSTWWNPDPDDPTALLMGLDISTSIFGPTGKSVLGVENVWMEPGYIFTVGGETTGAIPPLQHISRYNAPDGVPGAWNLKAALDDNYPSNDVMLGTSDTGDLYVMVDASGSEDIKMWKFDEDLNLLHFWDVSDTAGTGLQARGNFHVYNNKICFKGTLPDTNSYVKMVAINPDTFLLSDYGTPLASANTVSQNFVVNLSGCLMMDEIGTFSLCPPPAPVILGVDIVAPVLKRGPHALVDAQIDVSDLTQEVRGAMMASQMTKHNFLMTLRQGYFFDVTEYDGKIVARNRGHDAIANIPDGDLGAHEPGSEPPEPLETNRTPEAELPQRVWVNYYDVDRAYQRGSQSWARTVTSSQAQVTIELPIALTASEALHIAQWHMHFAWLERERFIWYTDRSWSALTPTDVVVVRGRSLRITNKVESPSGVIKWEGVVGFAGPFTPYEAIPGEIDGAPGSGQPDQDPPLGKADTGMILLDLPWMSEDYSATSMRVALYKDGSGSYSGSTLYKSVDGGTTYTGVAFNVTSSIVGTANELGDFFGGNVVDESNIVRVTLLNGATLSSTTDDGLLNGQNLIAIGTTSGWEVLQFRTATLVAAGVYDLSGLLRGRYGTEWMMGAHASGDVFVLLDTTIVVPMVQAHVGLTLSYKAVTNGTAIADATAVDFAWQAVALKPLAPVLLGGGYNAAGDLLIHWTPRRRGSGGWPDGVDLPATETPEAYQLQFATDGTFAIVVRQPGSTTATYTYTAAMQSADGLSAPINVRVAQAGAAAYGYWIEAEI